MFNNRVKTPQVITNQSQQVTWMGNCEPFGKLAANQTNSIEMFSRFPGQYVDQETNLYYNYFRDYDLSIGRYIESDPIGLQGGINTYAYVTGNPLKFFDFLGLSNCYFTPEGHRVCKGPDLDPQPNRCPSGDCAVHPPQVPGIDQQTDPRPISEINCGMCELNCAIVSLGLPGPAIPYPRKEVAGWLGAQAGGWAICKTACHEKCKDNDCQK